MARSRSAPIIALLMGLALGWGLLSPTRALGQEPSFEFRLSTPVRVGGAPGSMVRYTARVQLVMSGLRPDEGPRGWSLSLRPDAQGAGWRVVDATTDGTLAGPQATGGLRLRDGFERTEITTGAGNHGVVSAVTLSNSQNVVLPASMSPADILVVTLEGPAPRDGCVACVPTFVDGLVGSGQPVPNVVSFENQSHVPVLRSARVEVCGACFDDVPIIGPWRSINVGDTYTGAARGDPNRCLEICGIGRGHGPDRDEFQALSMHARGNMDTIVELSNLAPLGEAGVCLRVNSRLAGSAYMGIALQRSAAGGLRIVSSIRRETNGKAEGANPVDIARLPVYLAVRRVGSRVQTLFGPDPASLREMHLEDVSKTELAGDSQEVVMYCASGGQGQAVATFCNPRVSSEPADQPPVIRSVSPNISPLEGGIEVKITGARLCPEDGATEVSLAGIPAKLVTCDDDALVVIANPSPEVVLGDVVVRTPLGEQTLPGGFLYIGRGVARADCNCDGQYDISDALGKLSFLFLGADPCCCPHALDSNADGSGDISDPLTDLTFLFLGGPPPAAPFPRPGPSPDVPCDLPVAPEVTGISQARIAEGDIVTIRGLGFSPNPEDNLVLFGDDAPGEVIEASDTRLFVRVPELATAGRVAISVIRVPGFLGILCKTQKCSPVISGLGFKSAIFAERIASSVRLLASSQPTEDGVSLVFDPRQFDAAQPVAVRGGFDLPPISGLSFGSPHFAFEHTDSSAKSLGEFMGSFAATMERQLDSAGAGDSFEIAVDVSRNTIQLKADDLILEHAPFFDGFISVFWQNCKCNGLDPDANERDYGWCRFTDIITSCNGVPRFQYFIPDNLVMQQSSAIFPLGDPLSYSPSEKRVLYNRDAYCHVRKHNLWNQCKLTKLRNDGETEVPEFPCKAIVVKTQWRTAGSLPANPDPDDLYYHYDHNGTRFYLTLLHYTDKSRKDWHWADLYVAEADGGIGGCGGSQVGMPAGAPWVAPWNNYSMCTNITDPPGPDCGKNEIPVECVQTCQGCHDGATSGGTLKKDFLFSLGGPSNIPGSPDCD